MNIAIINYDLGNLKSVEKVFTFLGHSAHITRDRDEMNTADMLLLPGVGAFEEGMTNLKKYDLVSYIRDWIASERPFMSICLGYQLLMEYSEENGSHEGLGIFKGRVVSFNRDKTKVPHMGWNELEVVNDPNGAYAGAARPMVYFVHSYYIPVVEGNLVSTITHYDVPFVSSIQSKNLLATQFHPEKSGTVGITILKQFINRMTT